MKAIAIIQDEHRAITAVVEGLRHLVAEIVAGRMAPDHALLGALFHYIEQFPERLHHPKEDDFLFPALRQRDATAAAVIDDLQREHHLGPGMIAALKAALDDYRKAGATGLPAFRDAVKSYCEFQWKHMSKEEKHVLPTARDVLTAEDWAAIDAAFNANDNPWEGAAGEYKQLFTRIVSIAPDPIGLGDRGRPSHG